MFLFWVVKHLRFRKYDSSKQIVTCTNPIVMFILFKSQCRLLFLQKSFLSRVLQSPMVARQHNFAALSSTKFLNRRFVSATRNELPFQTLKLDFPCRLLSAATDPKASIKTNQNKSNTKITHSERINKLKNEFPIEAPQFGETTNKFKDEKTLKPQIPNRIYTLPNVLCVFRIGLTPVVGYLIVQQNFDYALALCAISAFTDFLDGWIARTFDSESKLGAVLDPLADKLLVAVLTFTLTYVGLIPIFLTGLILTRDALIVILGLYLRFRMLTPPRTFSRFFEIDSFKSERFRPTLISKVNTGFQLSLVLVSLASPLFPGFFTANQWFLQSLQWSTGVTTLWSGLYYLTRLK